MALHLNDVKEGFLVQGHIVVKKVPEGFELLAVRKFSGEKQVCNLFKAKSLFLADCLYNVCNLVASEKELSLHRV